MSRVRWGAALVALTLTCPAAAQAGPSQGRTMQTMAVVGSGDRVLVSTQDSGGKGVVAAFSADGTGFHAVGPPNAGVLDYDPIHRLIALLGSDLTIQVAGSDGGNLRRLLDTSQAFSWGAHWRPGPGSPLLAVLIDLDDGQHLFVADPLTGAVREPTGGVLDLSTPEGAHDLSSPDVPEWSPDGLSLVISAVRVGDVDPTVHYFRVPVAGGAPTQFATGSNYYPSPSAGRAYVISGSHQRWDLVRLNSDLAGATVVDTVTNTYEPGFEWSADGTRFLLSKYRSPVEIRDRDGRLLDTIGERGYETVGDGGAEGPIISISPNGQQVLLTDGGPNGGAWVEDLTNQRLCQISHADLDQVEATWSPDGSYVLLHRFHNVIGTWADAPGAKIIASPADFAQTDFISFEASPSPNQQVTHPCPQVPVPRVVTVGAPVHHGVRAFKISVQDKHALAQNDCTRHESVRIDRRGPHGWQHLVTVRTDSRGRARYHVPNVPYLHYRLSIKQRNRGPFTCLADSTTIHWGPPGA